MKVTKAYLDLCDLVRLCPIPVISLYRVFGTESQRTVERRFQQVRREGIKHGVTINRIKGTDDVWRVYSTGELTYFPRSSKSRFWDRYRAVLISLRLCPTCKAPAAEGIQECRKHADEDKARATNSRRKRRKRGRCRSCIQEALPGFASCFFHLNSQREYSKRHREKRRGQE